MNLINNPSFTIGILSFNHPELTQRTIESCLKIVNQEQVIICHNGSENRWVERLQSQYPRLKHLIIKENFGFTSGANQLLTFAFKEFEWCLFLTNDVQLLNFKCPENKAFIAPLIYRRKLNQIDSVGGHFYPNEGKLEHCRSSQAFLQLPKDALPYIPGTAFWLHRIVFNKVGLFNIKLNTYWEDVDYSQRVIELGFNLETTDKTQILHSVGKTCHKKKFYTNYLFLRNKYYVSLKYTKNYPREVIFKILYWYQWARDLLKAFLKKDKEVVLIKIRIFKDLMFDSELSN